MPFQDHPNGTRAKAHQVISGHPAAPQANGARAKAHQVVSGHPPQQRPNGTRAKAAQVVSTRFPQYSVVQGSVLLTSVDEATAIIRAADDPGHGPANRVRAARSMTGIPYKQQTGVDLRAGSTPEALQYMDCSELVSRVLAIDGITKGVLPMNTGALKALLSQKDKFEHSKDKPRAGDIALWEGHVGIVSDVDAHNKFKMIHATGGHRLSVENKFFTTPEKYRSGKFYGYYRPIGESLASNSSYQSSPAHPASTVKKSMDSTFRQSDR